jgi:CRISPR/Cas system CSM-associated protein Csm3 (group 7 of RAMP superfamily)
MSDINYKITFYSDWHTGSGLTSGSDLDALVIKTGDGLPFIPGKTLKGLLKEAAIEIDKLKLNPADDFIQSIFGESPEVMEEEIKTISGISHFSNAELDEELKNEIQKAHLEHFFFRELSSTAILEIGTAKPHSLRKMEVSIPCILNANVLNVPDDFQLRLIECFKWIKRLGQNRNRGLGRCKFEPISEGGKI